MRTFWWTGPSGPFPTFEKQNLFHSRPYAPELRIRGRPVGQNRFFVSKTSRDNPMVASRHAYGSNGVCYLAGEHLLGLL